MRVSICIPTFNRSAHLKNCLNSIALCEGKVGTQFEVCVSDNGSTDDTEVVVKEYQSLLQIKYHRNDFNLGIPRNFIKVVSMAEGEFVWLLGDDDLLLSDSIGRLCGLIDDHPLVDFFFGNSFHLTTEFVDCFDRPFDTSNLPNGMEPFSKWRNDGELPFLDLIDPSVSFDFLGGMFLSVFRKKCWDKFVNVLDENAMMDDKVFSHFDNTFPHVKIFAHAFSQSSAYFNSSPLNVCLTGAREWSSMSPLIMSVRLVEAIDIYRNNGLPYLRYLYCKNFALRNFIPDFVNMILHRKNSGFEYFNPFKLVLQNMMFPNFYLSVFYFFGRRLKK